MSLRFWPFPSAGAFWLGAWVVSALLLSSTAQAPEQTPEANPACTRPGVSPDSSAAAETVLQKHARSLGRFNPSFFQTVDERDSVFSVTAKSRPVKGIHGEVLARVSPRFYRRLCVEGSGRLLDGRVITFSRRQGGEPRFRVTSSQYGITCRATPLVPYRSVAVDRRQVRLGSVLYIPAAEGLVLPDGTVHDGVFFADDVGGAVRGRKIDLFVGFSSHTENPFTASQRIVHARPVEVFLIPPELAERYSRAHRLQPDREPALAPD
ncbi:MAG: 3D domain protein [Candidatus Latescibacteria bacterium ADurb.Bin168]|nr:MAG: 3D domain protein [Candidatus Latescibacteria bacterium ADurb.Bin168]